MRTFSPQISSPSLVQQKFGFTKGSTFRNIARKQAEKDVQSTPAQPEPTMTAGFQKMLVGIVDDDEYLAEGTKQALRTACAFAKRDKSDVTLLLIDQFKGSKPAESKNAQQMADNIKWHMQQNGVSTYSFVKTPEDQVEIALGDTVDAVEADVLILSSQVVHNQHVNANLLAEFANCPLLLLP